MDTQNPLEIRTPGERLVSMDAYRGLVMVAIASSAFGIPKAAESFSHSPARPAAITRVARLLTDHGLCLVTIRETYLRCYNEPSR